MFKVKGIQVNRILLSTRTHVFYWYTEIFASVPTNFFPSYFSYDYCGRIKIVVRIKITYEIPSH